MRAGERAEGRSLALGVCTAVRGPGGVTLSACRPPLLARRTLWFRLTSQALYIVGWERQV